jgi:transposase
MSELNSISLDSFLLLPELRMKNHFAYGRWGIGFEAEKDSEFEVCPNCAKKCHNVYDKRTVKIKDAPIRDKAVFIFITKRRFVCTNCNKVFTEPVSGIGKHKHHTARYRRSLVWASETFRDLKMVQKQYRCSAGMCFKTVFEELELRQRSRTYALPEHVGIDEHSIRKPKYKATEYTTILVDHKNSRVYDLIEGRTKAQVTKGIDKMKGRENVKIISMDLSPTYRAVAKETFPDAMIVADRFHVQRLFSRLMNKVRREVMENKRKGPIRGLLLRNESDLESHEKRAMRFWLNQNVKVKELHEYKEAMRRVYRAKGIAKAAKILENLMNKMVESKIEGVRELKKTISRWKNEILAYHRCRLSNGRVEGFNRKAKLCQRSAYGFKNFANYRLRLLNICR